MADTTVEKPAHLRQILEKARPQHEQEVKEAEKSLKEARLAIPTPMLDVIFRDGRICSFSYAYLAEVDFVPGDTMTLKFSTGVMVVAEGRDLRHHRLQIRLHRAEEIRECTESELMLAGEGGSVVERIRVIEADEK